MRHYELVVILSPMLNQEQSADAWGRIKGFINNRDADIFHEENWGTRRLAYSIRKGPYHFLEGTYHLTRFSTEAPFNRELETFLRLDEQVLRSLLVVTDPPQPTPEPSPVMEKAATEAAAAETAAASEDAPSEDTPSEDAPSEAPAPAENAAEAVVAEPPEAEPAAVEEPVAESSETAEDVVEENSGETPETVESPEQEQAQA